MTRRERLAELMENRRLDLKLTWREVAEAAGITTETLRQVRYGTAQIQKLTQRRVEGALAWQPGSIATYLAGGDPPSPVTDIVPWGPSDRVSNLPRGMTIEQLFKTVVANKAITLADRAAFVRAVEAAIDERRTEPSELEESLELRDPG